VPEGAEPWSAPGWRAAATAWIERELHRLGRAVVAPIQQPHVRPWSTILRAPTESGPVYFKAVSALVAHEVAVTELLAKLQPESGPELLASDREWRWLLLGDAGEQLRERVRSAHNIRIWCDALPAYASLQIALAGHVDALLAIGVPDRRLDVLPALYAALLADTDALMIDQPGGLAASQYQRLGDLVPRVERLCQELARYGIPDSLNHGDFHDGNVFQRDGNYVVIDWGDSVVSHPFFSARTMLVSAEISLDFEEGAATTRAALEPVREAYLLPWGRYTPIERLREALDVALPLASINGALGWHRIVAGSTGAIREEHAWKVPALLLEFHQAASAD
jgi:hypothetical protein